MTSIGRAGRRVLIAGGGVAALEAALALRDIAGDGLEVELRAPRADFVYRPFAVGAPFGAAGVLRYDLAELAKRIGVSFRLGGIVAVDPEARIATDRDGKRIPFDYMLVACGARMLWAVPGAVTFWGVADEGGFGGLVRRLRSGVVREVVFTMPSGQSWGLPLYELALLCAAVLAKSGVEDAGLTVVTPEDAPLDLFGHAAGEQMSALLAERGIGVVAGTQPVSFADGRLLVAPGDAIAAEAVVSLPRLEGRGIDGLPADENGFLHVDEHCRVGGIERVFAAGDVTAFPIKQGEVAARQAAAAAESIPVAGRDLEPAPFDPVLRRSGNEVPGRYLAPFLAGLPAAQANLVGSG
jgi:sulfide:quinone oxidoreductase